MQKSKWTIWIELAAALSVLVGLLFVAQEIRQNNQHARAESVRDLFQMWSEIYQFEYENGISQLVKKSIELPNELTDDEILKITIYLDLIMNALLTQATMQHEAGLVVGDIVTEARQTARWYFSSEVSRAWLRANKNYIASFSPNFYSALIREIEEHPVPTKMPQLDDIKSRL